jgi:hypothetical protein
MSERPPSSQLVKWYRGEKPASGTLCGACAMRASFLYPVLLGRGVCTYPDVDEPVETSMRVCNRCYRRMCLALRRWLIEATEESAAERETGVLP